MSVKHSTRSGILDKIPEILPKGYYELFKSHLTDWKFITRTVQSGVPQSSVSGPIIYVLFTADIPI